MAAKPDGDLTLARVPGRPSPSARQRARGESEPLRMLGYVRVSTHEQALDGFSLDSQTEVLRAAADRAGWELEVIVDAGYSGRSDNRPGLQECLRRLRRHEADGLVVVRLDRLARSVKHLVSFAEAADRQRWNLVALDMSLDTTTPNGRLVVHILAAVAQWESEMIGVRTREGMAEAKAQGARFGFVRQVDDASVARIRAERSQGNSFRRIARDLDADGVPTPAGGKRWYASTVRRIAEGAAATNSDERPET
jgi:DNA invertase Pin-like site-specific DNA recombinase